MGILDFLAPPDLRIIQRGSVTELKRVNTTKIPNGALALVIASGASSVYQFWRSLSVAEVTDIIVAPGSGPGRWVAIQGLAFDQGFSTGAQAATVPTDVTIGTQSQWEALPAGLAIAQSPPGILLTVSTSGVVTYSASAPAIGRFSITCVIGVGNTEAGAALQVGLAITTAGALIGTTTASVHEANTITSATQDVSVCLTAVRQVSIAPGTTFQPIIRNNTSTADLRIDNVQMIISPT